MRDNNANVDGVDTLGAGQFNAGRDEVQNAVTASGKTLDPKLGPDTNTSMLAGAMTESCQTADFYNDTGAVNAYVLTAVGAWVQPLAYRDGMKVRFVPGNSNTGASTINVAGLGVKDITLQDGTALSSAELTVATLSEIFFDNANDRFFIAPWVTATGNIDASQVVSGVLALPRIPSVPASQTTSGTFAAARLPAATLTAIGAVERLTDSEAQALTDTTRYMTAGNLGSIFTKTISTISTVTSANGMVTMSGNTSVASDSGVDVVFPTTLTGGIFSVTTAITGSAADGTADGSAHIRNLTTSGMRVSNADNDDTYLIYWTVTGFV